MRLADRQPFAGARPEKRYSVMSAPFRAVRQCDVEVALYGSAKLAEFAAAQENGGDRQTHAFGSDDAIAAADRAQAHKNTYVDEITHADGLPWGRRISAPRSRLRHQRIARGHRRGCVLRTAPARAQEDL